jgi:hypothetical protein
VLQPVAPEFQMADEQFFTSRGIQYPPPAYQPVSTRTTALELRSFTTRDGGVSFPPRYAPPSSLPAIPEDRDLELGPPPYGRSTRIRWKWVREGGWRDRIVPAVVVGLVWALVLSAILLPAMLKKPPFRDMPASEE